MSLFFVAPFDYQHALSQVIAKSNMSQVEIADRLGISQGRVSQILNGTKSCSAKYETRFFLYELCQQLDIQVKFLDLER